MRILNLFDIVNWASVKITVLVLKKTQEVSCKVTRKDEIQKLYSIYLFIYLF